MGEPAGLTMPTTSASVVEGLAFATLRPLFEAASFDELGHRALAQVRHLAPAARLVLGWLTPPTGPAAWRWDVADPAPQPLAGFATPFRSRREPVVWRSQEPESLRHRLWVPASASEAVGGVELAQAKPFEAVRVVRIIEVVEAMGFAAREWLARAHAAEETRRLHEVIERRTAFFAQTSHELRTPLTAILGYVELLREALDDPDLERDVFDEDLGRIHASASHLIGLVGDVLDLAKAERGKADVVRAPVDLRSVVDDVDDAARGLMAAQGNRWVVDCPADVWAWGDERRLHQVLLNLVGNAAKFTEHGEVGLVVESLGDDVVITVSDTGIGMSGDQLDRIFEPFEQAHPRGKAVGTGLGLAISAQYVERMGGAIHVQSQVGVGTQFAVTLAAAPPG